MLINDFIELLQKLKEHRVEFVVVGAYAMGVLGYTRATGDLDICVRPSAKNAKALVCALAEFGAPMEKVNISDFERSETVFQIGVAPVRVDILTSLDGVLFDDIRPEPADLGGITVPVIDLESLLKNKRATGRLRDLADCEELEKRRPKK